MSANNSSSRRNHSGQGSPAGRWGRLCCGLALCALLFPCVAIATPPVDTAPAATPPAPGATADQLPGEKTTGHRITTAQPADDARDDAKDNAQPLATPEPMPAPEPVARDGGPSQDAITQDTVTRGDSDSRVLDEPALPNANLTSAELALLRRGRISGGAYVGGGLLGTWLGFGLGHAVQGRYDEGGLIFSAGETTGFIMLIVGAVSLSTEQHCPTVLASQGFNQGSAQCETNPASRRMWTGVAIGGGVLYGVLRIWEIVDLWTTPPRHNAAYQRALAKSRGGWSSLSIRPVPLVGGGMALAEVRF